VIFYKTGRIFHVRWLIAVRGVTFDCDQVKMCRMVTLGDVKNVLIFLMIFIFLKKIFLKNFKTLNWLFPLKLIIV
jgi:hypothetical protein